MGIPKMKHNMNKFFFLLFSSTPVCHLFAQKIDYNHFDTRQASLVLFEKMNQFRDTITLTGYGKQLDSAWHDILPNNHQILQLTWSEQLYQTVAVQNASELVRQQKLFHVDREEWWKDKPNQAMFMDEVYPYKQKGFDLTLSENAGYTTHRFDTYQELATHLILCWEDSFWHRCAQRGVLVNTYFYEKGAKNRSIAAACVMYSEGVCYFLMEFVY